MFHDYNTRNKKKSTEMSRGWLDKLEKFIVQSINGLKDEIINLKDIVINKLQDENARLEEKCEKLEYRVAILESNQNDLVHYGTHNNVIFSGTPENVPNNNFASTVISVFSDMICKWSQVILRRVIELENQNPKCRRPLFDLLTEKTVKRF